MIIAIIYFLHWRKTQSEKKLSKNFGEDILKKVKNKKVSEIKIREQEDMWIKSSLEK